MKGLSRRKASTTLNYHVVTPSSRGRQRTKAQLKFRLALFGCVREGEHNGPTAQRDYYHLPQPETSPTLSNTLKQKNSGFCLSIKIDLHIIYFSKFFLYILIFSPVALMYWNFVDEFSAPLDVRPSGWSEPDKNQYYRWTSDSSVLDPMWTYNFTILDLFQFNFL